MTAVTTLALLLTRHRFSAPLDDLGLQDDVALLTRFGLATTEASSSAVLCNACSLDHAAAVVSNPSSGEIGWFCPESGFVPAANTSLEIVRAKPEQLVALLAEKLNCRRRRQKPLIEGKLWRVGTFDFEEQGVTVYLALGISDTEIAVEVASAIAAEAGLGRGLLLTPNLSGNAGFVVARCAVASLEDIVAVDDGALKTNQRDTATLAGVELRSRGGRPQHPGKAEAQALIRSRFAASEAEGSKRAEARAVSRLLGDRAPGETTLIKLIKETRELRS